MEILAWLENSGFGTWVRESGSLWAYPSILFLHTVGLGMVVGINAVIDLMLIGLAADLPVAPLEKLFGLMWAGFWINAVSGTALLIADATTKLMNPVFYIKLVFVALAVTNMVLIRRRITQATDQSPSSIVPGGKLLATMSLILWAGAITAGRLMAYLGPVSGAPGLTNRFGK